MKTQLANYHNQIYCWCQNETWFPGNTTPGNGELYLFDKKGETLPEWEKRSRANASIKKELVKTITEMLKAWKLENKKFAEKISKATVAGNWSYCNDTPHAAGEQIVFDWLQDNIWYPGELYQFSEESTEEQPLEEAVGKNVYVIINFDDDDAVDGSVECMGAFSTLEKAKDQLALTFRKNGKRGNIEVDNDGQDDEYVVTANGQEKNIVIYELGIDSKGMTYMTPYK